MNKIRFNLSERRQDKSALVHSRMRNDQIRFMPDEIAVEQQVEIYRTGRIY